MTLEEPGQSLGASPLRSFLLITLPNIWRGLVSGWLFAFVVSYGEVNTTLLLTGPGVVTLPIKIFSYLQFQGSQLVVAAASALQVVVIILILMLADRLIGMQNHRGALIDMQRFTTRPELCGTFGAISSTHWLGTAVGVAVSRAVATPCR